MSAIVQGLRSPQVIDKYLKESTIDSFVEFPYITHVGSLGTQEPLPTCTTLHSANRHQYMYTYIIIIMY